MTVDGIELEHRRASGNKRAGATAKQCSALLSACAVLFAGSATQALAEQLVTQWAGFHWQPADRELYVGIKDYAQCVVDVKPREVEAVLALASGSSGQQEPLSKLVDGTERCMSLIAVQLNPQVLRGALVEALYRREDHRRGDREHERTKRRPIGFYWPVRRRPNRPGFISSSRPCSKPVTPRLCRRAILKSSATKLRRRFTGNALGKRRMRR